MGQTEPGDREEMLLQGILNGETESNIEPGSRKEMLLKAILENGGGEGLPRVEIKRDDSQQCYFELDNDNDFIAIPTIRWSPFITRGMVYPNLFCLSNRSDNEQYPYRAIFIQGMRAATVWMTQNIKSEKTQYDLYTQDAVGNFIRVDSYNNPLLLYGQTPFLLPSEWWKNNKTSIINSIVQYEKVGGALPLFISITSSQALIPIADANLGNWNVYYMPVPEDSGAPDSVKDMITDFIADVGSAYDANKIPVLYSIGNEICIPSHHGGHVDISLTSTDIENNKYYHLEYSFTETKVMFRFIGHSAQLFPTENL